MRRHPTSLQHRLSTSIKLNFEVFFFLAPARFFPLLPPVPYIAPCPTLVHTSLLSTFPSALSSS